MIVKMPAAALSGLEAISLSIEVHITRGIKFFLVGCQIAP